MQERVKIFNQNKNAHKKPMPASARILDIQSELGELSKEYLSATKYGTENFIPNDDFKLEFGDTLYSLLSLAVETNINAKECLDKVLKKYTQRLNNKNNMGSN